MTDTAAYPRVPEHLVRSMQEECQQRWGYTPDEDTARIWVVKRDHDRQVAAREAGQTPESSEIDYGSGPYALFDRIWAPDPGSR